MTLFIWTRIYIFSFLPLLLGGFYYLLNRRTLSGSDVLEEYLVFYFAIAVAGSGIWNFFSHFFISDIVAKSIGWSAGSPFQLEVAFANLAIGILGLIAVGRRDGYREAAVTALAVFSIGATVVHFMDIAVSGNLAPGNSIQNIANIFKPAVLIFLLKKLRKNEAAGIVMKQDKRLQISAGIITGLCSATTAIGFTFHIPLFMSFISTVISLFIIFLIRRR
ncbi:MAG: hypothetical protein JEZ04_21000 [Spirochaetales bacterium]|nr:hypothetical protein [Spirochaetales bacterium]